MLEEDVEYRIRIDSEADTIDTEMGWEGTDTYEIERPENGEQRQRTDREVFS